VREYSSFEMPRFARLLRMRAESIIDDLIRLMLRSAEKKSIPK
jgi:hypothetical protein